MTTMPRAVYDEIAGHYEENANPSPFVSALWSYQLFWRCELIMSRQAATASSPRD